MLVPWKRIARTREGSEGVAVPRLIPCQLDIAVDALQSRVAFPWRSFFAAQRALQSAMSPVFVWSDTTAVVSHGCVVCPRASNNNVPDTMRSANSIVAALAAIPHRMDRRDEGG